MTKKSNGTLGKSKMTSNLQGELNPSKPLLLEHQLQLCEQIAAMVKSGIPIERGLASVTGCLPRTLAAAFESVVSRLEQGQSLSRSIAGDERPSSRSLAATVQAGVEGNCLDQAMRSWIAVHTEQGRASARIRTALLYPSILILVAATSLGFTLHNSIPLYKSTLESLHTPLPKWFDGLMWIHSTLWIWIPLFVVLAFVPLILFYREQSKFEWNGMPSSRPFRMRLQSHANRLLSWMLEAGCPFDSALQLAIESTGFRNSDRTLLSKSSNHKEPAVEAATSKEIASDPNKLQRWQPISKETQSILEATHRGDLTIDEARPALQDLANLTNQQADIVSLRQSKTFPIVVSIVVGIIVMANYVVFVYLPWVYLLSKLSLP